MSSNPFKRYLGDQPREVGVLTAVAFAVAVGFGIVFPTIPLFASEFGVSKFAASAVVSAFAFMRFVSSPPAGWLVNRVGERLILAIGIGIVAISSVLAGFAQTYWQLLMLRGVGGLGSAMFTVSAFALLLRVVEPNQRARASGSFQGGFLVGGITGPLFGAPLAEISLRLPFFVYGITLLAAGAIGLVFLASSRLQERAHAGGTDHAPTPLKTALRSRAYWAAMTNNFATGWAVFGLRGSLLPLFVVDALMLSNSWSNIGIFVSAVAQGLLLIPAGHASDSRGRRPSLILGAGLLGTTWLVLSLIETQLAFLGAMVIFGTAIAFIGTSANAVVGDVVAGRGGPSIALYQMSSDLGAIIGPLAAGAIADSASFGWAFGLTAGIGFLGMATASAMPETLPARTSPKAEADKRERAAETEASHDT